MSPYSSKQILDWFIARNRAEIRLEKRTKQLTSSDLQFLMHAANKFYFKLYNQQLFQDQIQNRDIQEIENDVSDARATELARNYDQVLSDEKAATILNFTWSEERNREWIYCLLQYC